MSHVILLVMKRTNALDVRQSLGKILRDIQKDGEPVMVEQRSKPAAVLISLEDYQKRFVDVEADSQRRAIVERIKAVELKAKKSSLALLHGDRR
jgi:prevent-host-death family protein